MKNTVRSVAHAAAHTTTHVLTRGAAAAALTLALSLAQLGAQAQTPPQTPVPAPAPAPAPAQTPSIYGNLSLEQATQLMQAGFAWAREKGTAVTIVVVDAGGHVVTGARMNGMPFGTFDVARGKAIASVATGGESGRTLMERYRANPIVFGQISSLVYGGPMFPSQGSLPIFINGQLVGAAAGSGASSQTDEDAVRAGIAAIGAREARP